MSFQWERARGRQRESSASQNRASTSERCVQRPCLAPDGSSKHSSFATAILFSHHFNFKELSGCISSCLGLKKSWWRHGREAGREKEEKKKQCVLISKDIQKCRFMYGCWNVCLWWALSVWGVLHSIKLRTTSIIQPSEMIVFGIFCLKYGNKGSGWGLDRL